MADLVDPLTKPAGPNIGNALKLVASDSGLVSSLSPEAQGILGIALVTAQSVVGPVVNMVEGEIANISSEIAQDIAGMIGSIADAIPLVGTAVGLLTNFISGVQAAEAREEQAFDLRCQRAVRRLAPFPVYSDTVRPCDIFARYINIGDVGVDDPSLPIIVTPPWPVDYVSQGDLFPPQRSLLGQFLIFLTEANNYEGYYQQDRNWKYNNNWQGGAPDPDDGWFFGPPQMGPINGLTPQRRAQFKAVRKAIEAQMGIGDGGRSFWLLYIDMLRIEYEAGNWSNWLNDIATIAQTAAVSLSGSGMLHGCPAALFTGPGSIVEGVNKIVQAWSKKVVKPRYEDDKLAQQQMLKMINEAKSKIANLPPGAAPSNLAPAGMSAVEGALYVASTHPYRLDPAISPAARVAIALRAKAFHENALKAGARQAAARAAARAAAKMKP